MLALPGSQACQLSNWSHRIGSSGSPTCWLSLQVLRLISLHNHMSQFLIINISLCVSFSIYIYTYIYMEHLSSDWCLQHTAILWKAYKLVYSRLPQQQGRKVRGLNHNPSHNSEYWNVDKGNEFCKWGCTGIFSVCLQATQCLRCV